jgi:hypothetical protein
MPRTHYRADVTQHPIHARCWTWEIEAYAEGHAITFAQSDVEYPDRTTAHEALIAFAEIHDVPLTRVAVAARRPDGPQRKAA